MENKKDKQLLVRISKKLHGEVKARAALRNISMGLYVERVLTEAGLKEKQYDKKQ